METVATTAQLESQSFDKICVVEVSYNGKTYILDADKFNAWEVARKLNPDSKSLSDLLRDSVISDKLAWQKGACDE